MPVLDLSHPFTPDMTVFPGDPQPAFTPTCVMPQHNCRATLLSFTSHTGTHVDAPSHTVLKGGALDAFPLSAFMGRGAVVDCTGAAQRGYIGLEDIKGCPGAENSDILLLRTGWDAYFGTEAYFTGFPCLDEAAARWLAGMKKSAVAVDALSADPADSYDMPVHRILLEAGVLIYENLRNLGKLPVSGFSFYGLPLSLPGLDASPVRAAAVW